MTGLPFFDCNVAVGRGAQRELTLPALRMQMERHGIREALVYHLMARESEPAAGNRVLCELLAGSNDLHPCWITLPHHTGEFPPPDALLAQMRDFGVRAVRLFPALSDHYYSLEEWVCDDLFAALEAARVPVLLDFEQTDWPTLHRIGATYPRLPLVVLRFHYRVDRNLYPLLARCPGIRLEVSWYQQFRALEETAKRFGAERLLFGSALPECEPGGIVARVEEAELSMAEQRLIAGDNLRHLLAEVRL
ncbi:MAG: amidohydrolase family protein [Anaerolineae bacterium]|nr:amidohydrolase family protein [Anaerolineae bacterium]